MNLQEEIARVAWELYEKSGHIDGRDVENWLDAERIVLSKHAGQELEEPEEEEALPEEGDARERAELAAAGQAVLGDSDGATVMEEFEVKEAFFTPKKAVGATEARESTKHARKPGTKKRTTTRKTGSPKK